MWENFYSSPQLPSKEQRFWFGLKMVFFRMFPINIATNWGLCHSQTHRFHKSVRACECVCVHMYPPVIKCSNRSNGKSTINGGLNGKIMEHHPQMGDFHRFSIATFDCRRVIEMFPQPPFSLSHAIRELTIGHSAAYQGGRRRAGMG